MTHLYIELNGITEEVNSLIIEKLYNLASSGDLDETSDLKGRLHSSTARDTHVAYLNEAFDELYINADSLYITFVDPEVERVLVTKYGDGTNVTTSDMSSVTSINDDTGFSSNQTITLFPELKKFTTLINLNHWAFLWTTHLTTIDLTNIQHIGGLVFYGSGITGVINLPNIVSFGNNSETGSFGNCANITEVNIGPNFNNDTLYMSRAFSDCTSLTKVTGLSNITSIPEYMFNNCTSLTSVDIDLTKITSIGEGAFKNTGITKVKLSNLSNLYTHYDYNQKVFGNCTSLTEADFTGSTITTIDGFYGCTNLASVTIPSTVTRVEMQAFTNTKLTSFDFSNIRELGRACFKNTKLTSVDLSNITKIDDGAFVDCTLLTSITLPSGSFSWVTEGNVNEGNIFAGCTGLSQVIDLSNCSTFSGAWFRNCSSLTQVILPLNINKIYDEFFYHCSNLSSLGSKITPTYIGDRAFEDCTLIDNNDIDLSAATYIGHSAMKNTAISGVLNLTECLTLGENTFNGCTGITEIHAPKLTDFNRYAGWDGYNNLEVLDFPVSTRINFVQNNPKLTTINAPLATKFSTYADGKLYLPNNPLLSTVNIDFSQVTEIGDWCFDRDTGLNGQYLEFPNVTAIGAQAFGNNAINFVFSNNVMVTYSDFGAPFPNYAGTVYVPDALLSTYRADSIWSLLPSSQMKGMSELPQS